MKLTTSASFLSHLEIGFRTDAVHMAALGRDVFVHVRHARHFCEIEGLSQAWKINWNQEWDTFEGIIRRIREHLIQLNEVLTTPTGDPKNAQIVWEALQAEDVQLRETLLGLRAQVVELNSTARADWNVLVQTLASHFTTIQAWAQTVLLKSMLLEEHTAPQVESLVQDILNRIPAHELVDEAVDEAIYANEYDKAAKELESEKERYLGVWDMIKAMFMWVESPEERLVKNGRLLVSEHQVAGD